MPSPRPISVSARPHPDDDALPPPALLPGRRTFREGAAQPVAGGTPLDPAEPAWRAALVRADGVRYTRTPDRVLRERQASHPALAEAEAKQPVPALAAAPATLAATPATAAQVSAAARAEAAPQPVAGPLSLRREKGASSRLPEAGIVAETAPGKARPDAVPRDRRPSPADGAPVLSSQAEPRLPQPAGQGTAATFDAERDRPAAPDGAVLAAHCASFARPALYRIGRPAARKPAPEPERAQASAAPGPATPADLNDAKPIDWDLGYLRLYAAEPPLPGPVEVDAAAAPPAAAPDEEVADAPLPPPTSAPTSAPTLERLPPSRSLTRIEGGYEFPLLDFLAEPPPSSEGVVLTEDLLEETAGKLERVIRDFGVKGEVIHVHPGPVVTLYELEPAPGTKSSRVISLADDIARSMSAVSARVAVVQGRNAIGIELPNARRETVYLRELLAAPAFAGTKHRLALCLGKTIGGEPVIADLARMPHLLVAGTTGSGKSVAINTMILSLLYRLSPEECRLIMVDPKMLELSVYDGIPHLLTPVVTDPKKAVVALKWAVREMEERYRKMSKLGVRNIDGFNARVAEAKLKGEAIARTVQTGFDRETGEAVYEEETMDLDCLPYIVVIVDEMADLMMVAGKDIEGAIQRLAQMARAAGIHVVLATQRPSVDVITGTIKANFPTRISFQVTSKIDSRTILGEMGAEQLLGQGDMLHMAGGGRITRVHGPFCSDEEVEKVVAHLKRQGKPVYLDAVTADDAPDDADPEEPVAFDDEAFEGDHGDVYDQAVAIVLRHQKASTSYIQRRLQIGYNRAASLMERMEKEGIVGPANHAGKREILLNGADG